MFKDVIISSVSTKLKVKKGLIMIFSFLFHSTIIFAVLVGPLLETDTAFSEVKVIDVFLKKVPPQVPKALSGKKPDREIQTKREIEKKKIEKKIIPHQIGKLITPIVIPDIFEDEEPWQEEGKEIDEGPYIEGAEYISDNNYTVLGIQILNPAEITRIIVKQAKRIKYVAPVYSKIAKAARVDGIVIIEAKTDVFGNVVSWKVISGHPLLNGAAINAIKKWKYEPYIVGGIPKSVAFTVTINFTLKM